MNEDVDKLWRKIRTQRDELRVRSHLARAEFEDEWRASAKVVMEELSAAYDRIKHRLGS